MSGNCERRQERYSSGNTRAIRRVHFVFHHERALSAYSHPAATALRVTQASHHNPSESLRIFQREFSAQRTDDRVDAKVDLAQKQRERGDHRQHRQYEKYGDEAREVRAGESSHESEANRQANQQRRQDRQCDRGVNNQNPAVDESELVGLVYSLTDKPEDTGVVWYKRVTVVGAIVLALTVALNIIFW